MGRIRQVHLPQARARGSISSRFSLLSSYPVKNAHVRDQPSPGLHINFHGVSQVGDYQLKGESREGQNQNRAVPSPCRKLEELKGRKDTVVP